MNVSQHARTIAPAAAICEFPPIYFWNLIMVINDLFIRRFRRSGGMSEEELADLGALRCQRQSFRPGEVIVSRDQPLDRLRILARGMAARCHYPHGRDEVRVITALHVPGDLVDLEGLVQRRLDHDIVALGDCEVEAVDHHALRELTDGNPALSRVLWGFSLADAAIYRQWLVAAASLRSSAHLAHLICELYTRLAQVGAARNRRLYLPLLQRELAEILGYSSIHINRAVRDLRDRELVRWSGSEIAILDWDGLRRLAHFDPGYLEGG